MLSRNFCQKSLSINFRNFHTTVWKTLCGNFGILLPRTAFSQKFRQINVSLLTVWKSNVKRDHPQKFSVKLHTWILPILLLEMHGFLSLWDTFRLCWLNEICRVGFLLDFYTSKNISLKKSILELFLAKVRSFLSAYNFWRNQSKSGFLTSKDRSNPLLLISIEKPGANLRENSVLAISWKGFTK